MPIIQTFQFSPYYSNFYSRIISIGPPVTVKHSSGNSLALSRGLTVFGSLEPSPRVLLFPLGGGLQSTLRLRLNDQRLLAPLGSILKDEGVTI